MKESATSLLAAVACLSLSLPSALADEPFQTTGVVHFENLQAALNLGEPSPYVAIAESPQLGVNVQTGSILPTSEPEPVGMVGTVVTLQFTGVQGPHPAPGQGNVHIIHAKGGKIFCTWTAVFTIELDLATGDSILSGDGDFTVIGGTGQFRNATGEFRTLFESDVVPAGADSASAVATQEGVFCK